MNGENGTLKIPTIGRMVIYTDPMGSYPAVVVKCTDEGVADLTVFTSNIITPVHGMPAVPHVSKTENNQGWHWPEIK
jgi:hypothetical protein